MRMIPCVALVAGLLSSTLLHAEVQVEGPVEYGLFDNPRRDAQPGERVLLRSGQAITRAEQIPMRLGTRFGVRFRLSGKRADDTPLTLLYLTPGVVTSDGMRHDRFEVTHKLLPEVEQEVMAFEFSEPHELAAGEWQFMVFQGDRKLIEQRFMIQ